MVNTSAPARAKLMLPERTQWLFLCHEDPTSCAQCMGKIAAFLAMEMSFELEAAVNRPAAAYQAELGADRCTLEQAHELRRLTCEHCTWNELSLPLILADDLPTGQPVGSSLFDAAMQFAAVCVVLIGFIAMVVGR